MGRRGVLYKSARCDSPSADRAVFLQNPMFYGGGQQSAETAISLMSGGLNPGCSTHEINKQIKNEAET